MSLQIAAMAILALMYLFSLVHTARVHFGPQALVFGAGYSF